MPDLSKQPRRTLTWEELCRDPNLHDLPFKIETNDRGQIVMSPVFSSHSFYQSDLVTLMNEHLPQGRTAVEFAVRTPKGTKVADVAWLSPARAEEAEGTYDTPVAPEICVEVLSPTNTPEEIEDKTQLYFEAGAEEVWTCDADGRLRFFDPEGERETPRRAPDFPHELDD
jgi:Uma2 family endonuclease